MKRILSPGENRRIARAMLDYSMLSHADRVLIAVSGGIDSLVLAWVLQNWRNKAPIDYAVQAVYVDMQPSASDRQSGGRAGQVADRLAALGLSCMMLSEHQPTQSALQQTAGAASAASGVCFQCARNRRRQLFAYARQEGYSKIALGHHRDDIVETFFINLTCSGNISTMRPRQELFSGRLALIRPLAYLKKEEIRAIGRRLGLEAVPSDCPLSEQTRRLEIRALLDRMYQQFPGSRDHIFSALGNVRQDYLLLQEGEEKRKAERRMPAGDS
ncbi:MAG: ATP-binding protein [Candidatus Electrothrix sp. YB6]